MIIFLLSIAHLIENEFFGCPRTFLRIVLERNCPTLLRIGPAVSFRCCGVSFPYSWVQNFFTTGSVIFFTTLFLYTSLVSMRGIEIRVVFGYSISARIVFLRVCSSLGPQESPNILLKIPTSPEATKDLWSSEIFSSMLNAIGQSLSDGSNIIVWFVRFFGICPITASARSPWGSITATHRHLWISSSIIFSRSTDFPIPVFPIIYIWRLLSSGPIPKLMSVPLKFVFQIGVRFVSGVTSSDRSGSIIGRLDGGSNALLLTQLI